MYVTITVKLILAFVIALLVGLVVGRFYVPWLRKIKAGQEIREDGPTWHMSKSGTPTMGGVIFIAGLAAACLTAGFSLMRNGQFVHIIVLAFALCFGAIGFLDDYEKLRHKQNLGLRAKPKFILQLVVAIVFVLLLRLTGYLTPSLYIPFWNVTVHIPEVAYMILAAFIIVGAVNAVNLTDGIDGLAAGVSLPVFVCYSAIACMWGWEFASVGVFSAGLTGGLLAFLFFNYNPAKCFMGDTGSLFLGGAVCGVAFALDMPLILVPLGIVYIIETLSVIIQVGYFKISHGKRVFKMAPFHHHLEMGGWTGKKWTEKQIFALFTGVSLLFAVISLLGVMNRYAM